MAGVYRGWDIYYSPTAPVTGKYRAVSFGVSMCAGSRVAIERMIDQRLIDYPGDGHGNKQRKK
jgi:hypothetical protein